MDVDPLQRLLAPDRILAALRLPRTGRVLELGTQWQQGMPVGPADAFPPFGIAQYRRPRGLSDPDFDEHDFAMETVSGPMHVGTHIDAFAHIQSQGRMFGGHETAGLLRDWGWAANGVEHVPPILTRGILLNLPRHLAGGEPLPDGFEVLPEHIDEALARAGLSVRDGDAVIVRTGKFARDYHRDARAYFGDAPGVGPDAAIALHEQGMALLGSDTSATDALPFPNPRRTTHKAMLVERGVHLVEIMDLEAAAAEGATEFLFVCLALRIRGATGSWVRPVAIL